MSIISTVPKGAAVEGINPNLLRNWYFVGGGTGRGVFPVNSRGASSYTGTTSGAFTIDNWNVREVNNTLELYSDGVLASKGISASRCDFYQQLPAGLLNALQGKKVTASVFYQRGFLAATFTWGSSASIITSDSNIILYSGGSTTAYTNFCLRVANSEKIYAAKLELGDQQTLAHQENGVWVLNEIPDYEEEYYRCITSDADSTDTYANQKVSNITVQCNSVGSSSLRYYNKLIQSTHKVLDSTFSNPAAQTSDITVTTYDGYLDFSNGFASGATTNITLVLGTSGPVLSTSTTAPS